jgi:uncharacterized protein YigA (DUF484 family)
VQDTQLRASRAENEQLEGKVAQLEENEGKLQTKLVRQDFDLQHYHSLKAVLDDKVAGLEKALANLDEAARIRVWTAACYPMLCVCFVVFFLDVSFFSWRSLQGLCWGLIQ